MRDKKGHLYGDKDRDSNQQPNKRQLSLSDKLSCEEKKYIYNKERSMISSREKMCSVTFATCELCDE